MGTIEKEKIQNTLYQHNTSKNNNSTKFYSNKPICIITYNEIQAKKIMKDMEFFKDDIRFFKKRDITSFDYIAESKDNLYDRIEILNDIIFIVGY